MPHPNIMLGTTAPTPLFQFKGHQLRHIMIEGEPWFVAGDVCRILNVNVYKGKPNPTIACRKLGADEKGVYPIQSSSSGLQPTTCVSESGLYKLIMRSDKPEAKAFQDWVTIETALAPVDHQGAQMIDARALHGWLGITTPFHKWFARRVEEYGFSTDTDFRTILSKTGGRPKTDHFLTINMAKELAMVERTPIGKVTRRYFIKMEEAALERGFLPKLPDNLSE